jgi:type IX secretion system PorP/SprF family membrane protein
MYKMKKFLFGLLILVAAEVSAQDPRFSQFHLMPQYLNPAMTGFFDGDVRFAGIYRNQWFTLGSPNGGTKYETEGGEIDGRINVGKPAGDYDRKQDYIGVGGAFIRDVAGDEAFTSTDGFISLAYSKTFGYKVKHSIAIGLQGEVMSTQFRNGGATFPDGIIENIGKSNIKFDATVGITYHVDFMKRLNMYVGFAYSHIASPSFNFLDVSTDQLYAKYVAHAGAVIAIRDRVNLVPALMFMAQGPSIEANIGANAQYIFGDVYSSRNSFSFGLMARFTRPEGPEAIIPNVRLEIYHVTLGVAYDINISNLERGTHSVGAIEVAAVYIFKHRGRMIPTNTSCAQW